LGLCGSWQEYCVVGSYFFSFFCQNRVWLFPNT
jgi:hypothetical protein